MRKRVKLENDAMELEEETTTGFVAEETLNTEETEEQKAIRALISSANGDSSLDGPRVEIIPPPSEDDAYRQDVAELPDPATMEDYERTPVDQFGAALLRGMGWKEGTAASRKRTGPVEPWLPQARPALLGIGAKEKEQFDDGSKGKKKKTFVDKRYIPVIKQERRAGESGSRESDSRSGSSSRRRTPSPSARRRSQSAERTRDRDRYRPEDRDRVKDRYSRDDRYGDREGKAGYDNRDVTSESRRRRETGGDRSRDRSVDRDRSDKSRRERDRR
ncbi:DExH-box splicing factor binding site-domain-containing protein [Cytidiella melzeri]|nr:DExH-box splicing factor binding site-domain-containing protein [Cytidiella melzeri]